MEYEDLFEGLKRKVEEIKEEMKEEELPLEEFLRALAPEPEETPKGIVGMMGPLGSLLSVAGPLTTFIKVYKEQLIESLVSRFLQKMEKDLKEEKSE